MTLESDVTDLWERYRSGLSAAETTPDDDAVLDAFLDALEAGEVRAAEKTAADVTSWEANEWVKRGILLNFGLRATEPREYGGVTYYDVLPLRDTADLGERGTRNTPDGTVVRRGAYLGREVLQAVGVPVCHAPDRRIRRGLDVRVGVGHSRSASSRCVASSVSSSTCVATTAGLYAPPSKRSWSPTDDSTIRVNARRSAGR